MKESKYLGCFLSNETDIKREINKRKADVFVTWKKLETHIRKTPPTNIETCLNRMNRTV